MALPIAIGTTATAFADGEFTVDGTPVTLHITQSTSGAAIYGSQYELAYKASGGAYVTLITLTPDNILENGQVIGNGTYAIRRLATGTSSGLESA
jgi:hypothetical protein